MTWVIREFTFLCNSKSDLTCIFFSKAGGYRRSSPFYVLTCSIYALRAERAECALPVMTLAPPPHGTIYSESSISWYPSRSLHSLGRGTVRGLSGALRDSCTTECRRSRFARGRERWVDGCRAADALRFLGRSEVGSPFFVCARKIAGH